MALQETVKNNNLKEKKVKVWIGDDKIVYVTVIPIVLAEEIEDLAKEVKKALEASQNKARILVFMDGVKLGIRSHHRRKRFAQVAKDLGVNPGFEKAAIYGVNTIIRTVASFIIATSGLKNVKIFKTKEDALEWLNI